ncbi:hypothetical protein HOLleu_25704 [Holothuria leucospilota]|uniref:Uncharacterized protein n=1 Tax=Holothuria leucospilota TaxID=206669 RepID=A0A9Q1H4J4_HOLLE|nr:hypothetical protein HOLleu_25704 [Holothuria leucospilota]
MYKVHALEGTHFIEMQARSGLQDVGWLMAGPKDTELSFMKLLHLAVYCCLSVLGDVDQGHFGRENIGLPGGGARTGLAAIPADIVTMFSSKLEIADDMRESIQELILLHVKNVTEDFIGQII